MRDISGNPLVKTTSSPKEMADSDESRFDKDDYRFTTLEPNRVFMQDGQMEEDEWSQLAFSLGMPTREMNTPSTEAKRFAQRVKQRKKDPNTRIDDLLGMLLLPLCKAHDKIDFTTDAPFWREAIPQEVTEQDVEQGWSLQLPTPKPAFTFGYRPDAFRQHYRDLQNGIVNKDNGEPCNLSQVSQPAPEIYWPFLVIESRPAASSNAMRSAKYACAGAAATCNNAIIILSNAAQKPNEYSTSPSLQWDTLKLAQTFSLAVDGRIACLSSHNSQGILPHAMTAVRSYNLEDEIQVQMLCSRLKSIMVWAENFRLPTIMELLDRLDRRVHLGVPSKTPLRAEFDDDVWHERYGKGREKRSSFRSTFKDKFPSMARVLRFKVIV
jgi:hypothetical protein